MATSIENDIGNDRLTFARFKAFQDLSHKDVCKMFGCSLDEAISWANGDAPQNITDIAIICHQIANKARYEGMSDSELQYFEKQKEKLVRRIQELESKNERLASSFLNRASKAIKSVFAKLRCITQRGAA